MCPTYTPTFVGKYLIRSISHLSEARRRREEVPRKREALRSGGGPITLMPRRAPRPNTLLRLAPHCSRGVGGKWVVDGWSMGGRWVVGNVSETKQTCARGVH